MEGADFNYNAWVAMSVMNVIDRYVVYGADVIIWVCRVLSGNLFLEKYNQ